MILMNSPPAFCQGGENLPGDLSFLMGAQIRAQAGGSAQVNMLDFGLRQVDVPM
jgi:hypothetical protein